MSVCWFLVCVQLLCHAYNTKVTLACVCWGTNKLNGWHDETRRVIVTEKGTHSLLLSQKYGSALSTLLICMHCLMWIYSSNQSYVSPVHTRVAGSGFHLPSAPHTVLILPAGTNIELHMKNISAPSSVSWYGSMEPLPGVTGCPQLTG